MFDVRVLCDAPTGRDPGACPRAAILLLFLVLSPRECQFFSVIHNLTFAEILRSSKSEGALIVLGGKNKNQKL